MYKLEPLTEDERKLVAETLGWDYCEELSELDAICYSFNSCAELIPLKVIKCRDGGYLMMVPDSDPEAFEPKWHEGRLNSETRIIRTISCNESLEYILCNY